MATAWLLAGLRYAGAGETASAITLRGDGLHVVLSEEEPGPLKIALDALKRDLENVLGVEPVVVSETDPDTSRPEIVIVNRASGAVTVPPGKARDLDGFESHRVHADPETNRIYLEGYDLRGTIFALYTFSEEILGVPPLHYWSSWAPEMRDTIEVPGDLDLFFRSPQVRYRSILPGDQDFFMPWKRESPKHNDIWRETTLRLKMNMVEGYSTIEPGYRMTNYAYLIDEYGLALTSHHTSGLNTSFSTWNEYWDTQRNTEVPAYRLSDQEAILDFFRYNAETVHRSGIENLWTVAFRGERDQPFWSIFEDSPESDRERADVINRMLQIQYDIIRETTGEEAPYARVTFYDEIASLMAKGLLEPPEGDNVIWTFVAGRRDHYPYDDLVRFNPDRPEKLGYYMNFGFASTGAHVAPAEGPWKMEFNFRYVNSKSPLYFSVVNIGNFREFVMELSANAKLLWDFESYDTDAFLLDYCRQYFGSEHARAIAQLYRDFYDAYWQPKAPEFEGMDRQFVFQDLRYARAFDHIFDGFFAPGEAVDMNPLHKIGYESVPGRTFRIDLEQNHSANQVDALLHGMKQSIPRFESVATRSSEMMPQLEENRQTFFNDNLRLYAYYMTHLSKALYHYVLAYKEQKDPETLLKHLDLAQEEVLRARDTLMEGEHGLFSTWYTQADPLTRTFQINSLLQDIEGLKERALEQN